MRLIVACAGVVLALGLAGAAQVRDPAGAKDPIQPAKARELFGKILSVDTDQGRISVDVIDGDKAMQKEFKVTPETKYFGLDRQPLERGILSSDLQKGAKVWFETGTVDVNRIVVLRLYNPMLLTVPPKK